MTKSLIGAPPTPTPPPPPQSPQRYIQDTKSHFSPKSRPEKANKKTFKGTLRKFSTSLIADVKAFVTVHVSIQQRVI